MAEDQMKELIHILNKMNPDTLNGCVIIHMDKETKQVKSISPMVAATSIVELYQQLDQAKQAIEYFLQDLVNKGLYKNGQAN